MGVSEVFRDPANDRLVFIDRSADEDFWDSQWAPDTGAAGIRKKSPFVQRATERYLSPPDRVLDAGCGLANTVFGLHQEGFDAYGVDFAPETVAKIQHHAPELKVRVADVRDMPFDDNFFDGVWSLGVIEHFPEGYEAIVREAWRVIKPGRYLFLTVPSISPLRRLKMSSGRYRDVSQANMDRFYQFAFPPRTTAETISKMGFKLVASKPRGGYLGLVKESGRLGPALQTLHSSKSKVAVAARRGLDLILSPASFHTMFFVFEKK